MQPREIERLLPSVFQRTLHPPLGHPERREPTVLGALIEVMSALHAPSEAALDELEKNFDPRRAPDRFVPFLAAWVNLDFRVTTGPGRQRELIAAAAELSRWRGTARGLIRFLELATGETGFRIDEQVPGAEGKPRPFHVRVEAPAATRAHQPMLEQIIEREKPAYVTYELTFVG
jgi:phage tail-like protein